MLYRRNLKPNCFTFFKKLMKFYKKAVELFDNAFLTDIVKKTNVLRFNYSNDYESGNAFVRLKSIPQHYRKKLFISCYSLNTALKAQRRRQMKRQKIFFGQGETTVDHKNSSFLYWGCNWRKNNKIPFPNLPIGS